jgi:hypothetical protein
MQLTDGIYRPSVYEFGMNWLYTGARSGMMTMELYVHENVCAREENYNFPGFSRISCVEFLTGFRLDSERLS